MTGTGFASRATTATDSLRTESAAVLAGIGLLALAAGVLVYVADRDAASAALIPTIAGIAGSHLFGAIGQWLPSFVHPFAFSLFTVAANPSRELPACGACAAWWTVNVAFELAQHPVMSAAVVEGVQSSLGQTWPSRPLSNFFLRGTFDVGDLVAVTAGALAASAVLFLVQRREARHVH